MKGILIGAGIGGLTMGVALHQRGIPFTLYEAAPEFRAVWAGIWMATNAMQVLKRLGLAEKVMRAGVSLEYAYATEQSGKPLQTFDFKKVEARYGVGTCAIHRAHLQEIRCDALPTKHVVLNKRLHSIEQDGHQVVVTFEDRLQDWADFVIGADGIKSVTRKAILGEVAFRYSGQTCWRGIADLELTGEQARQAYEMWGNEKGLRFGFSPVNQRQVYFFTTQFTATDGKDEPGTVKAKLKEMYRLRSDSTRYHGSHQ